MPLLRVEASTDPQGKKQYRAIYDRPEYLNPNTKKYVSQKQLDEDEYNLLLKYQQTSEYKDFLKNYQQPAGSGRPTAYFAAVPTGAQTVNIGNQTFVQNPGESQQQFSRRFSGALAQVNAAKNQPRVTTTPTGALYSSDANRTTGREYSATLNADGTVSNEKRNIIQNGQIIPVEENNQEFQNFGRSVDPELEKLKAEKDAAQKVVSQIASGGASTGDIASGSNIGQTGGSDNVNPLLAPTPPDYDAVQAAIDEQLQGVRKAAEEEATSLEDLFKAKRAGLEDKVRADKQAALASFYGNQGGREGAQSLGNLSIANQEIPRAGRQELSEFDAKAEAEVSKVRVENEKKIQDISTKINERVQKDFETKFDIWKEEKNQERLAKIEDRLERQFSFNQEQAGVKQQQFERIQERLDKTFETTTAYKDLQLKYNLDKQTFDQISTIQKNYPGTGIGNAMLVDYLQGVDPKTGQKRINARTGLPWQFDDLKPILDITSKEKLEAAMEFSADFADLPYSVRSMILETQDLENKEKLKIVSEELWKDELSKRKKSGGGSGGGLKLSSDKVLKAQALGFGNVRYVSDLTEEQSRILLIPDIREALDAQGADASDDDILASLRGLQADFSDPEEDDFSDISDFEE